MKATCLRWMLRGWPLVALLGCTESPGDVAPPTATVQPPAVQTTVHKTSAKEAPSTAEKPTDATPDKPAVPEFEPPFPPRANLFAVPSRSEQTTVRAGDGGETIARVTLKGFVNVGAPRAVLLIGDEVAPLAAGEERHGVEVIAINPPQVTLQRGRNRWTESLQGETN